MANYCKFYKEQKYISYDSGVTWSATGVYRKGALIESLSYDCGFIPPTPSSPKWVATYAGGSVASAECDSTSAITQGEIVLSHLVDVQIGTCVSVLEGAFDYDGTPLAELTSVTIPNSVVTIGQSAFAYCASLTSIEIPNSVTTIGGAAFLECTSLTSITIPNSVTSIGNDAFGECNALSSVTIGSGVTTIGNFAFYRCYPLSSITIPSSVTSIGNYAFADCASLTSIEIPNSTTSIGEAAFVNCSALTSVSIGSGITAIGESAFSGCSITSVTIDAATPPTIGYFTFINDMMDPSSSVYPIHVPCGTLNAYKTAWNGYIDTDRLVSTNPYTRTVSGTPYCYNYAKCVDVYSQISCDGSSWTTTTTTTELIENCSEDCGCVPTVSGDYLTFAFQTSGKFLLENYNDTYTFEYSRNGESWTTAHTSSDIYVSLGDVIKFRGNIQPQQIASKYSGGIGVFETTAQFAASGNPLSMVLGDNFSGVTSLASYPFAFAYLFHSCSNLVDINGIQLPFETLSDNCYRAMFTSVGITALTANILSAATAVTSNCFYNMFLECHSLESVPSGLLPHTTLAYNCYAAMFYYCDSLQIAPTLPATTLVEQCYMNMFANCASLNYIECHATDISASYCTQNWLLAAGQIGTGTFKTPSTTNWSSGDSGIPNGWTRVDL